MIKNLMDASLEMFDESEIYYKRTNDTSIGYGNWDIRTISSNQLTGTMLRVKKDGRLGLSYATSLDAAKQLLDSAANSAKYGEKIPYSFSHATEFADIKPWNAEAAEYPTQKLIDICEYAKEQVKAELPDISLNIGASKSEVELTIMTSHGTNAKHIATSIEFGISAPIKGAGISVYRSKESINPFEYPEQEVAEFIRRYKWTKTNVTPTTKKMPVLWTPDAMYMFALSLCAGMSGEELVKKTSPLLEKFEKKILDAKLTIMDDPHSLKIGARAFDDEGIPTEKRPLIENGILKSYLLDLRTGAKLGARSSGNGFKKALFGGGANSLPNPWPANLWIKPGTESYNDIIGKIDEGIILTGGLGFHSSNYTQGHISVQAVGFMVEKGQVVGRLENTMVAGNIYEDFLNINIISKELELGMGGYYPYILLDSMQVVGK